MRTLLWGVSAVMYPVFCSVTASGPFRRPAALGLLLRILRPFGGSVPPQTSLRPTAKNASETSFGPPPEIPSHPPLGTPHKALRRPYASQPTRLSPPTVTRATTAEFNKRRHSYVP